MKKRIDIGVEIMACKIAETDKRKKIYLQEKNLIDSITSTDKAFRQSIIKHELLNYHKDIMILMDKITAQYLNPYSYEILARLYDIAIAIDEKIIIINQLCDVADSIKLENISRKLRKTLLPARIISSNIYKEEEIY